MQKTYILSDLHFGVRNNNVSVNDMIVEYFDWFIGNVDKDGCETRTLLVLGDVFNSRVSGNFMILQTVIDVFTSLSSHFDKIYIIAGNHDCYYLDNNSITSISMILSDIKNVECIETPKVIDLYGKKCLMFPWEHNAETAYEYISNDSSDYLFCHMEINGMSYANGQPIENKINGTLLKKYKKVYSGHIHKRQEKGNIVYVGTPYQLDIGDLHDTKGFYSFDESFNESFTENGISPFYEVININEILENDIQYVKSKIDNSYVDVTCSAELYNNFNLSAFRDRLLELGIAFKKMSFYPETAMFYDGNNSVEDTSVLNIYDEAVAMFRGMGKSETEISERMSYFKKLKARHDGDDEE